MVVTFRRLFGGALSLITQLLTAAIWISLLVILVRSTRDGIQEDHRLGREAFTFGLVVLIVMCLWTLAGAAGTLFWFFRQFQHAAANARFIAWLKANAEKIGNNEPVYYRCKRITLQTVLVRHHLVCSAVVLSSRMSTRWLILGQEPRRRHAWGASLYSFWNGWWGLPVGLIWTPIAIVKNLSASSTLLVEDLLRVPPPPPLGFKNRQVAAMRETTKELFILD
jgi:ABC-type multidrug transport system fused ATPase/permease subunit